jgi:hypothetical protein
MCQKYTQTMNNPDTSPKAGKPNSTTIGAFYTPSSLIKAITPPQPMDPVSGTAGVLLAAQGVTFMQNPPFSDSSSSKS